MIYIILGKGFEEAEAVIPGDLLRRAGAQVCYAGIGGTRITGGHGITLEADCTVEQMDLTELSMIVLPGGLGGVDSIRRCPMVLDAVRFAYENDRFVAAICAAPTVLAQLGITDGKQATCYPGMEKEMGAAKMVSGAAAVRDGKIITGTSAGSAVAFARLLVEAAAGPEEAERVIRSIHVRND